MSYVKDYTNGHLLADVNEVERYSLKEGAIIIDARTKGFEDGHIPGAVSLPSALTKSKDGIGIVPADLFTELAQSAGINANTTVIVYDEGDSVQATRLFYALEYYGHADKVKVLNGGLAIWLRAGKPLSVEETWQARGNFSATPHPERFTGKNQLQRELNDTSIVALDTRAIDEYRGDNLRNNARGGHIPGAVHLEWKDAVDRTVPEAPIFKSGAVLTEQFESAGVLKEKTVVPYCQSNGRGAHTYFALRLLGYPNVRPYEGSWAEWGNSEDTEISLP
ncbi:sulfurtransferase [Cohnella faecalis]|uniref:Sulfurtransferase n=1 Tax=Cohnella faecalis TaxID=2315694 RepID=A0A398CUD1_9BACL|nr:sulfurtransferase [Cohnella faecalis]RIE03457.1 sulfurtransferase [Cohnella faecalis]